MPARSSTPASTRRVVSALLHDVLTGASPGAAAELISNPILRQRVAALRQAFGGLDITPQVLVVSDEYAAVHFSARGVHRGTFRGLQASGRSWTASCGGVFRVEGGRITDFWLLWDVASILEQIGAPPPLGAAD